MIKLQLPQHGWECVYDSCVSGVADIAKKTMYENEKKHLSTHALTYKHSAENATLHELPQKESLGKLDKKQLTNLYSCYFVRKGKPARKIYDQIKLLGSSKCPYCSLPNSIFELDHYLPSSTHPIYSIFPLNLVPSCKNCNQGLKNFTPSTAGEEYFHPYFIEEKFCSTSWIEAKVSWDKSKKALDEAYTITFHANSVVDWSAVDNARAQKHFELFGLADAYSAQAAGYILEEIQKRKIFFKDTNQDDFSVPLNEDLSSMEAVYGVNHWKVATLRALIRSTEFCRDRAV